MPAAEDREVSGEKQGLFGVSSHGRRRLRDLRRAVEAFNAWIVDIEEGLKEWGQLGLGTTRALFDPQTLRDTQNEECQYSGDEGSTSRINCEKKVGATDVIFQIPLPMDLPGFGGHFELDLIYWAGTAVIAVFVLGACNASNLIDGLDAACSSSKVLVILVVNASLDRQPAEKQTDRHHAGNHVPKAQQRDLLHGAIDNQRRNNASNAAVVMLDPRGGPISGAANWSSGFMPARSWTMWEAHSVTPS